MPNAALYRLLVDISLAGICPTGKKLLLSWASRGAAARCRCGSARRPWALHCAMAGSEGRCTGLAGGGQRLIHPGTGVMAGLLGNGPHLRMGKPASGSKPIDKVAVRAALPRGQIPGGDLVQVHLQVIAREVVKGHDLGLADTAAGGTIWPMDETRAICVVHCATTVRCGLMGPFHVSNRWPSPAHSGPPSARKKARS